MIIGDTIKIVINKGNINKYKKLGYLVKEYDIIDFPINLLSKGSNFKIKTICTNCNSIFNISYKKYNKNIEYNKKFFCSRKCAVDNNIKRIKEYYGVNNISQIPSVKNKIKQTNIDRFNSEHYFSSEVGKKKIKQTILKRYGVDNYTKTDEYKIKATKTNLEKYGVEWTLQSKIIREKGKLTNLEKYGVEYSSQSKLIREKVEKTCYDKYGYKTNLLNRINIEKVKKTLIDKYGVDNPMKHDDIKIKTEKTNLEKYSASRYTKTDEGKNKILETNLKKYGVTDPKKHESFRKKFIIAMHKDYIKYVDNSVSLFKCDKGHEFEIKTDNFFSREKNNTPLCTICNPIGDTSSIKENELYGFIKYFYDGEVIKSYRDGMEIDIYLPEKGIGFEFNGLYWHSEKNKEKNYHLDKTNFFSKKGINIIHIWEDDWDLKNETLKSQIKNWIGSSEHKIYARNCYVKEVTDNKVIKDFLNANHIQGWVNSILKLGLYHNDELVSMMIFDQYEGRKKMEESGWNLSRFCNKLNHNVVGGASKLLNHFIKLKKPTRIVSYADRTWTSGNMYYKLGFKMVDHTRPDYKYIIENKRVHKSRFRKSNLNTHLTERQYMLEQGIYRIYDCGKVKFELIVE